MNKKIPEMYKKVSQVLFNHKKVRAKQEIYANYKL
jgi:hypothetical protein